MKNGFIVVAWKGNTPFMLKERRDVLEWNFTDNPLKVYKRLSSAMVKAYYVYNKFKCDVVKVYRISVSDNDLDDVFSNEGRVAYRFHK